MACLYVTYQVPGTVFINLYVFSHLTVITALHFVLFLPPFYRGGDWGTQKRLFHLQGLQYTYTYTFKYQLPSKLDEVVRGTNIRGVTPLCLALCKALDRQRWIKQGLVYPEHSIWQRRRGRHRIRWNNNVITDLPVKGQRCQGPKSRKWVMLGKGEARCPGFRRG